MPTIYVYADTSPRLRFSQTRFEDDQRIGVAIGVTDRILARLINEEAVILKHQEWLKTVAVDLAELAPLNNEQIMETPLGERVT